MMTPEFERALNEAVARLCGWKNLQRHPVGLYNPTGVKGIPPYRSKGGQQDNGPVFQPIPFYATDRNALPEVAEAVVAQSRWHEFSHSMRSLCEGYDNQRFNFSKTFAVAFAPPHLHCVAALKSCSAWNDDLEALWQKEQGK